MPLPRDVVYLTDGDIEKIADRVVAKLKDVMDAHDIPAEIAVADVAGDTAQPAEDDGTEQQSDGQSDSGDEQPQT